MKKNLYLIAANIVLLTAVTLTGYAHNHDETKPNNINLPVTHTMAEMINAEGVVVVESRTREEHDGHNKLTGFNNLSGEKVSLPKSSGAVNTLLKGLLFFDDEEDGGCPDCGCFNAHGIICYPDPVLDDCSQHRGVACTGYKQ